MKILISLFACATLSLGAVACGETGSDSESSSTVTFAVTEGRRVADFADMLVSTAVNSTDLSTTSKAVKQLRATNHAKFWKRG